MSVSYGGDSITFADGSIVVSAQPYRNRFINGNMTIDQRNNGSLVTGANNTMSTFMTDRWKNNVITGGGAYSAQRVVDAPDQFQHSLKLTVTTTDDCSTASDRYDITQLIEGVNIVDFALGKPSAKPFTVSFWVKSSITGTYSFSAVNNAVDANYLAIYTINAANTWEYKTISIPACTIGTWDITPGSASPGMFCRWSLGAGSTISSSTINSWFAGNKTQYTGGTNWISNAGATFQLTGCQIELGTTASTFEFRPYGTELALCQRYYYRLKQPAGTNSGVAAGVAYTTTNVYGQVNFPVEMRTNPTALEQNGTAGDYDTLTNGNLNVCTLVPSFENATQTTSLLIWRYSAGTVTVGSGAICRMRNSTSYLAWSAEL
jgi:hypothetical protein